MILALILASISIGARSEVPEIMVQETKVDSIKVEPRLMRWAKAVWHYFEDANRHHPDRPIDISFIAGPHYSRSSGFGIGIVGSGLYGNGRGQGLHSDSIGIPSMTALKLDVTTAQHYKVSTEGYHIIGNDRFRIDYDAEFFSFKDKFWGIGYQRASKKDNASIYKHLGAQLRADFVIRIGRNFYIGPLAHIFYNNATRIDNESLFEGQKPKTITTGAGVTAVFDTRDVAYNAFRGVYVRFDQLFNPRFFGNKYSYSRSELTAAAYATIWKGGILAARYHADITYGNTPWGMMPTFGGSESMRGYYEGRYRDKCEMDFTVELRQHIWRRSSVVAWVGAGSVFPRFSAFRWQHVLPNAGVGYRWEFKKRVNVRLDVGFGKGEKDLIFSINEAF